MVCRCFRCTSYWQKMCVTYIYIKYIYISNINIIYYIYICHIYIIYVYIYIFNIDMLNLKRSWGHCSMLPLFNFLGSNRAFSTCKHGTTVHASSHQTICTWNIWMFPKIGGFYPQNGWFISWKMLLKWDDLGVFPLFLEHPYISWVWPRPSNSDHQENLRF